jgi:hypothetical protein
LARIASLYEVTARRLWRASEGQSGGAQPSGGLPVYTGRAGLCGVFHTGVKWNRRDRLQLKEDPAMLEGKTPLVRFYTDAHVAKAVAEQLREKGVDVVRCQDVGLADADDSAHLEYATREGRILITHDQDFLRLHKEWQTRNQPHAGIMFCLPHLQGLQNVGPIIKMCLDYHELITNGAGTVEEDIANQVIFVG